MRNRQALSMLACAMLATTAFGQGATPPATTNQALQKFGHDMEASVSAGDMSLFRNAMDTDALCERAFKGFTLTPAVKADFTKGLTPAIDQMASQIQALMKDGGHYAFIRTHVAGGEMRAMFRQNAKNGLNYHDLCLRVEPGGVIRVQDIHVAVTGELLSQTLHRLLIPVVASANRGVVDRVMGAESDYMKHLPEVEHFTKTFQAQDFKTAHELYQALPQSMQGEQTFMLYDVMSLEHLDSGEYAQGLARYEKAFPDSSSVDLMRLDSTFMRTDWDGLLATVNKLDARVGGDPYLAFYRAIALQKKGQLKEASAALEKALEKDPTLLELYVALVSIKAEQKEWEATRLAMERMAKNTDKFLPNMTTDPQYAAFIKTPEFKRFQTEHPGMVFKSP